MRRGLVIAFAALALGGCATSAQQAADLASVQRTGAPAPLLGKMNRGEPLAVDDVVALSREGVHDDVIIRYIRDHHTIYRLTNRDFARLHHGGVSQSVIDFMDHTDYRGPDSPWGP